MLRWQQIGTVSHAVSSNHQPVAGERFRALCGDWCTVPGRDVQPYDPEPQMLVCSGCDEVWADMKDRSDVVEEVTGVVDNDGLRNTYTNAKGEQIDLDTGDPVDDEEQDR